VSFSILIGHNSVAEWLIVASTYHLNSGPNDLPFYFQSVFGSDYKVSYTQNVDYVLFHLPVLDL
jgi:hypothetical protein